MQDWPNVLTRSTFREKWRRNFDTWFEEYRDNAANSSQSRKKSSMVYFLLLKGNSLTSLTFEKMSKKDATSEKERN